MSLAITCYGVAIPKGSTKAYYIAKLGRAIVTADNRRCGPWQEHVVTAAREALGEGSTPMEGPVALFLRFYLPRAKATPRNVTEHMKKPDLDKLVRAVKDGLTRAGVYRDDAQVVLAVVSKEFAAGARDPEGTRGVARVLIQVDEFVAAAALPATVRPETYAQGKIWDLVERCASPGGGLSGRTDWPPRCPPPVE